MIPHISFTEAVQASVVIFALGVMTGAWVTYKLDDAFRRRKKG